MTRFQNIRAILVLCAVAAASNSAVANDKDMVKVTPQVSGVVVTLGSEGKPLAVGDRVVKDQIIAVLDDRLARLELQIQEAKLKAAQADDESAKSLYEEAKQVIERNKILLNQGAIGQEDYRRGVMSAKKRFQEVVAKSAQIGIATLEVERAKLVAEMHILRSPADGVVQAIYKMRGEGVKALESVMRIKAVK